MLFNSVEFIFAFLPLVFILYFILNKLKLIIAAKVWLVISSLFFYSWWNIAYLPLILISMFVNFGIGTALTQFNIKVSRKLILTIGVIFNLSLLGYYKYSDFFIANVNALFQTNIALLNLALPLAISFFTFQQIAYLVDAYRNETKEYDFLNYALFVTFFPQLIAGPIVHHKEMMPQFARLRNKIINFKNIFLGIFVFSMGLFKKVAIADTFAVWATEGFDHAASLTFIEGWVTSLSYTFQLYFDFSGYTDMAIGAALLLNIRLPINFNSPYKALNIQDFWRRWHITLSRFLTQYLYIPLGGNRRGVTRTYVNILIVFLLSGLWHGAGWTFIFWGFLHGAAQMLHRFWSTKGFSMPKWLAWFVTFQFVNVAWVFFRATSWEDALKVLKGMVGYNGFALPAQWQEQFQNVQVSFSELFVGDQIGEVLIWLLLGFVITVFMKNSMELKNQESKYRWIVSPAFIAIIFIYAVINLTKVSEFLYFNF